MRRSDHLVLLLAACAGAVALASGTTPVARASLPTGTETYVGWDVLPLWTPLALLSLGLVVVGLTGAARPTPSARQFLVVAGGGLAVASGLEIALIEVVASWVPSEVVPVTLRRTYLDLQAGAGLWIAFGAGVTAVMVVAVGPRVMQGGAALGRVVPRARPALIACVALIVGAAVAFGLLRYQPWLTATGAEQTFELEAWSLPVIGPWSLAPMWCLSIGALVMVVTDSAVGPLFAVFAGWLMSAAAATTVLFDQSISTSGILDLTRRETPVTDASVAVLQPVWLVFGIGIGIALVAGAALALPRTPVRR